MNNDTVNFEIEYSYVLSDHGKKIGLPLVTKNSCISPIHLGVISESLNGQFCRLDPFLDSFEEQNQKFLFSSLFKNFSSENSDDTWTYLSYGPFKTEKDMTDFLLKRFCGSKTELGYAIFDYSTQEYVGWCAYLKLQPSDASVEIGHIVFSDQMKRKKIGTEALYLLLKHAFDDLYFRRVEWKCDVCNSRSKNCALRLGFTMEGLFRQATFYKNRNRDTLWFGMLDKEWTQYLQPSFIKYLDKANYTEEFTQICRLEDIRKEVITSQYETEAKNKKQKKET